MKAIPLFSLPLHEMYFPANFEQKLGFDVIRQLLSDHCLSSLGRQWVDKISFSTDAAEIHAWLLQTAELKQILQFEEKFPSQDYYDLIPELLRIRIPGTYLETEGFVILGQLAHGAVFHDAPGARFNSTRTEADRNVLDPVVRPE